MTTDPDLYAKICVAEVCKAYKLFIYPYPESKLKVEGPVISFNNEEGASDEISLAPI